MTIQVSYMGTKRNIASHVAAVIATAPPGPLLDLFSGICAVASAVAPTRQLWCNDIQTFASTVASAFFTSPVLPYSSDVTADAAIVPFLANSSILEHRFAPVLRQEAAALQSANIRQLRSLEHTLPTVASSSDFESERNYLATTPREFPYRLFSISFAGKYFGLRQSIHIDSIRYAINRLFETGSLDHHQHTWMCLALCQAISKVATTTGHFAQYMRPKPTNYKPFVAQRSRSVWYEWLKAMFVFSPLGTPSWRRRNKVFTQDADTLLPELHATRQRPAVIYADPPYTADQYSRYYHLYETLLFYDYPSLHGTGRYRPDRFRSAYSLKAHVQAAMTSLISNCAKIGSHLVLSYPETGLLPDSFDFIISLLKHNFGNAYYVVPLEHFHSSLGASTGHHKYQVKELLFVAGGK